jgi:hypothetical protein
MKPDDRLPGLREGEAFRQKEQFLPRFVLSIALAPPHHAPTLVRSRDRWTPRALVLLRGFRR